MKFNDKINLADIARVQRPERFHIPFDKETVLTALQQAYEAEVRQRNGMIEQSAASKEAVCGSLTAIADWITNPNGKTGLLLYGGVGTGKTTAMYALCRVINAACQAERDDNTLLGYGKKVIEAIKAKEVVDSFSNIPMHFAAMKRAELLAIDEMGVENVDIRNYGNASEPIIDLLSYRYDHQKVTVVTSNLTMKQIEERYGLRLADRFNEMFKKIAFIGKSYRK